MAFADDLNAAVNNISTYQLINGARHEYDPTQNYVNYGFGRVPIGDPFAGLNDYLDAQTAAPGAVTAAPAPPQFKFAFDTIGQVIFRSIGHCRLPLRTIWAQGINESGDVSTSPTQTFAGAICAPIDQTEEVSILDIWDGGARILSTGATVLPPGWTAEDQAALVASLAGIIVYPGDESQLPAPLIVADKGATLTNAFRGIRYIIVPNYPIRATGGGLPQLSVGITRTNDGGAPAEDALAVEFLGGAS